MSVINTEIVKTTDVDISSRFKYRVKQLTWHIIGEACDWGIFTDGYMRPTHWIILGDCIGKGACAIGLVSHSSGRISKEIPSLIGVAITSALVYGEIASPMPDVARDSPVVGKYFVAWMAFRRILRGRVWAWATIFRKTAISGLPLTILRPNWSGECTEINSAKVPRLRDPRSSFAGAFLEFPAWNAREVSRARLWSLFLCA